MNRKEKLQLAATIAVIVLIYFGWTLISPAPRPAPTDSGNDAPAANAPRATRPKDPGKITGTTPTTAPLPTKAEAGRGYQRISFNDATITTLSNSLMTVEFSDRGGVLERLTYVNEDGKTVFYHTPDNPLRSSSDALTLIERFPESSEHILPLALILDEQDRLRNTSRWERVEKTDDSVTYRFPPSSGFTHSTESDGTVIFKTIRLLPEVFRLDISIRIENQGAAAVTKRIGLWGPVGLNNDGRQMGTTKGHRQGMEEGRVALYGTTVENSSWTDFFESPYSYEIQGKLEEYNSDRLGEGRKPVDQFEAEVLDRDYHGWTGSLDKDDDPFLRCHGLRTQYFLAFLSGDPAIRSRDYTGTVRPLGSWYYNYQTDSGRTAREDLGENAASAMTSFEKTRADFAKKGWQEPSLGFTLQGMAISLSAPAVGIAPSKQGGTAFSFYAGPRDADALEAAFLAGSQDESVDEFWSDLGSMGFFSFISVPMAMFLEFLGGWLGPGLAIIVLTLSVRVVLSPISYRGQKSMAIYTQKMKIVKPKLDAIKEKYKGRSERDSQLKMITETREVMREQNVSFVPIGGCLPMFLQLPIFFGLYRTFQYSFYLRQKSFLWIDNLTLPDATLPFWTSMDFGFLAFLSTMLTYNGFLTINVLPLIWVVLSVVQMRMQPKPDDPQQAAMQRNMGCIVPAMGIFFYGYASGFALYFIFSSLYSLGESKLIKRNLVLQGITPPPKKKTAKADDKPDYHSAGTPEKDGSVKKKDDGGRTN